jgi:hypothetical protein
MTLDTQRNVIKNQLRRLITIIIYAFFLTLLMLVKNRRTEFLGINPYQWSLILTMVFVILFMLESLLNLNYIYFSDDDDRIVFRYFSMSFLNKKKNSIEIPKDRFRGYILEKSLLGFKKKIILMQRVKDIDAKYPAVSISALNKNQTARLIKALDKYK